MEQYQEEYVSIKVPKKLQNKVLRLIEGKVDDNANNAVNVNAITLFFIVYSYLVFRFFGDQVGPNPLKL